MSWNPFALLGSALRFLGLESTHAADMRGQVEAISRLLPVIEFDLQGNVLTANDNFIKASGYSRAELRGMHHRHFVDTEFHASAGYREFWDRLRSGEPFVQHLRTTLQYRLTAAGRAADTSAIPSRNIVKRRLLARLKEADSITIQAAKQLRAA